MSSTERISEQDGQILLRLARDAIKRALRGRAELDLESLEIPDHLWRKGAAFVTLMLNDQLRGCIGHLEASQALVKDVVENALNAAFKDPRFAPLSESELQGLEISISVLSQAEPMQFSSEEDLLRQIRPGKDGLIIKEGVRKGTFLPSVWESLPDAVDFLRHLKQKAGLPADYWSGRIEVSRYTTQHLARTFQEGEYKGGSR